jgi:hypothetical protein
LELLKRNPKLADDFEEEWWTDFASSVKGNRDRPTVGMVPALMAARLADLEEA